MSERVKPASISSVGEFGLIDRVTAAFPIHDRSSIVLGVGDDAALIRSSPGELLAVSTDLLLEGVHFDLAYVPPADLGFKCVSVNVSDICAMNGRAFGITVGVSIPQALSLETIDGIYAGIREACRFYGVDLLGGDTTASRSGLCLAVTALGRVGESSAAYRSGARKGDLIYATGSLGLAAAGLELLSRHGASADRSLESVRRQLRPLARHDFVEELRAAGIVPSAMIDLSDGLASEIGHLSKQSGTGARIFLENLPIGPGVAKVAALRGEPANELALYGGEDYELLFTVGTDQRQRIEALAGVALIGQMTERSEGVKAISATGEAADLEARGWKHF